jgi:hypothetical protein
METSELLKRRARIELIVVLILGTAICVYIAADCIRYGVKEGFDGFLNRLGVGIAAICTLLIYSFLYRENPFYRLLEHILIGLSVGYSTGVVWTELLKPNWFDKLVGAEGRIPNLLWLLVLVPGVLWYFQLSRKNVWLSRILIMFFMGTGAGLGFRGVFQNLLAERGQITQSFKSILTYSGGSVSFTWFNFDNLLFIVIMLCVLSYFFFSFRHEKNPVLRGSSRLGRYFLMICFGTIFGTTVQGRMSLFIDRLTFLFHDWLGL